MFPTQKTTFFPSCAQASLSATTPLHLCLSREQEGGGQSVAHKVQTMSILPIYYSFFTDSLFLIFSIDIFLVFLLILF